MNQKKEKLTNKFVNSLKSILENIDLETIDGILDSRDSEPFSENWMNAWNKIPNEKMSLEKEREKIFKLVLGKTKSSGLSAYITEDFELIINYLKLEENNWVTDLCNSYFNGKIPDENTKKSNKTLTELLKDSK